MVVIEIVYIPALKGVALECVSLNSGLSVAPVSIPLTEKAGVWGTEQSSHRIRANKMAVLCVLHGTDPSLLCWDESSFVPTQGGH